jgi:hypothetical protein
MLEKLKKILGAITDLLLVGRKAGWYSEKHSGINSSELDKPAKPENIKGIK